MFDETAVWVIFGILVGVSFILDVGFCSKEATMSIRHALALSLFWILLAFAFNTGLYYSHGPDVALEFFASYLLEKGRIDESFSFTLFSGLSIDNVFVFYVIFENFEIPERYQRRVLQWGS